MTPLTPETPRTPLVAGLLLAAGGGRRLGGRPKALLPYRGRPLVENAVRVLREGGCPVVHVVLGASAELVRERAELPGCVVVENPEWAGGMGSSLRVGLASLAADPRGVDAALVSLVDQPGIGAAAVARLRAHGARDALAAASYEGKRGHPVLFGADRWAGIAAGAEGDRGAREYLAAHREAVALVECADVAEPFDIDTEADLYRLDG
ncbi:nucleotidyltransferase family protein [Streptomyces sp. NPDC007863]|uniref:nucleotidyltransferase family protein n=1 Tax=Streptomyces sp. NPDC007863 TaxID=3154894 RepID=UPI0033E6A4F6